MVSRLPLDYQPHVYNGMVTVLMPKHPEATSGGPTDSDLQGYGNRATHAPNLSPRAGKPGDGRIPLRTQTGISASDIEQSPFKYVALALIHLRDQTSSIAKQIQDNSRPVDEYTPQTLAAEAESLIIVQPDWDMDEVIESIVIVGPATGTPTPANQIALGATTVASYNNNPTGVIVNVAGGTVTVIAVNGVTTGLTSGAVFVPAGGTITLTYTVAPTTFTTTGIPGSGTNAITLQLGDRTWNLVMGPTGVIDIGPISMRLSRSDNRFLTAATPGNYTVELMGHADNRGGA
jgi:hypothetical protein